MEQFLNGKKLIKKMCENDYMCTINGLNTAESKTVWEKWNKYEVSNKQKDLLWMSVNEVLPFEVYIET